MTPGPLQLTKELVILNSSGKWFKLFYYSAQPQMMRIHVFIHSFTCLFNFSQGVGTPEDSEDNFLRCLNYIVTVSVTAFCTIYFILFEGYSPSNVWQVKVKGITPHRCKQSCPVLLQFFEVAWLWPSEGNYPCLKVHLFLYCPTLLWVTNRKSF